MKLNFGSEAIMVLFILGLLYIMVIQPTFYLSSSTSTTPSPSPGSPTPTPPASEPTATPTPPTGGQNPAFFSINPSTTTVRQGETLSLSITLDTGDFKIDTVDLVLNFDPQFLQADSINPGTIFPQYPVQKVENGQIIISAAGEIQNGQVSAFKGTGEYTRIVFQTLQTTSTTQITFDQNSVAASAGQNRLDLSKCQPGNYQIN